MPGCSGTSGSLDESRFTTPLPWVGLYVAGASLMCALLMGIDALHGFRKHKLWFPSEWFSLNAATLTILGIATKFPVDLNTPMPGRWDQLTKLSGTVLIGTSIANFMPSLGRKFSSSKIDPDVIAVAVFVGTVIGDVVIQMTTGVVYVYLIEHISVLVIVSVNFLLLASTALIAPTAKEKLDKQRRGAWRTFKGGLREENSKTDLKNSNEDPGSSILVAATSNANNYTSTKLKEYVRKYWIMAHSSDLRYVFGRSVTCTASGAFSLIAAIILTEAFIRSFLTKSRFCSGDSDYKWSTLVVLVVQYVAVVVGTIAPVMRWLNVVTFYRPERSFIKEFNVEWYWNKQLREWKDRFSDMSVRRFLYDSKKSILLFAMVMKHLLLFSMGMQFSVVVMSKLVRIISLLLGQVLVCGMINLAKSIDQKKSDLDSYVLKLEGEDDLVTMIIRDGRRDTDRWISTGRRNKCRELIEFIKDHSSISKAFRGVCEFDTTEEDTPRHCWALPVVTLTSIALALPGIDQNSTIMLLKAVSQGITYIRHVDKQFADVEGHGNMRRAAYAVWKDIEVYRKWYGVSLDGLKRRTKDGHVVVARLGKTAEDRVSKFKSSKRSSRLPRDWPEKVLAADCMDRICTTISRNCYGYVSNEELFCWIRKMSADILGSCFTNLSLVIYQMIVCGPDGRKEKRDENARDVALLLGKAEELLKMLEDPEVARIYPKNKKHISDWQNEYRKIPGKRMRS